VHLSADGVPVVIHDETVERTTDGRGTVAALSLSALRRLDAGSWFGPRFRGERIPTLDETLDWARGRVGLNVELKGGTPARGERRPARGAGARSPSSGPATALGEGPEALARAVARSLRRGRFRGLLIVSSFEARALILARAAMPRVRLGYLASRSTRELPPLQRSIGLFAFHPHHRIATAERIQAAHRRGLAVFVWPVNHLGLMRRLLRRGADGLMTDDPALFARL